MQNMQSQKAKAKSRRRRGGRNSRRKRGQQSDAKYGSPYAPAALGLHVGGGSMRSGGRAYHRNYGDGERFSGSITWAKISSNTFNARFINPLTYDDNDLYSVFRQTAGTWFNLHPANCPKLQQEALQWGKFIWKKLRFRYRPHWATSGTGSGFAFIFTILRDPSYPFQNPNVSDPTNQIQIDQWNAGNILQCSPLMNTSVWQPAEYTLDCSKMDLAYPTALPLCDEKNLSNNPGQSLIAPICEEYFPLVIGGMNSSGAAASATSDFGFLELDYEIEFYVSRPSVYSYMGVLLPSSTSSLSDSSSSGSIESTKSIVRPGYRLVDFTRKGLSASKLDYYPALRSVGKSSDPPPSEVPTRPPSRTGVVPKKQDLLGSVPLAALLHVCEEWLKDRSKGSLEPVDPAKFINRVLGSCSDSSVSIGDVASKEAPPCVTESKTRIE